MTHTTPRKRSSRAVRRPSLDLEPGPRTATITAILNYSKALKVVEAPPVGTIAMVLN
ncbi:MAG: hypothetical protein H6595_03395 [Flavobacteriales bacterium]|nr:hypothetical protein [Flavobacteriales bacterium]MCB9166503.1 hypothetical protein [Flavobacteriales bacterium]